MMREVMLAFQKTTEKVAETKRESIKKELRELPDEIGELSEIEALPDEIEYDLHLDSLGEIDERKPAFDDNGKLYRVDNDLLPNSSYEINGYHYETDKYGRIVSVEGTLHMKERDSRLPIRDSIEDIGKGDQKEGDDRGHLIGDQFDGSNGLENMIPQDAEVNRNGFKNLENELAREVKDGKEVKVEIKLEYQGESRRPEALIVTYSIDGEKSVRVFPNGQEE